MSKRLCLAAAFALTLLALSPSIGSAQAGRGITVEWQNAPLSHVVRAFATLSGRTIVVGGGLAGLTVATNLVRDEARKDARRRRHLALLAEQERAVRFAQHRLRRTWRPADLRHRQSPDSRGRSRNRRGGLPAEPRARSRTCIGGEARRPTRHRHPATSSRGTRGRPGARHQPGRRPGGQRGALGLRRRHRRRAGGQAGARAPASQTGAPS